MSSQGAFPGGHDDFGLIETFLWSREDGYALLAEHLARLEHSAAALGFSFTRQVVESRLHGYAGTLAQSPSRVRLVLARDGTLAMSATALGTVPTIAYRVAVAEPRHRSGDPWLQHKTTMRDRYEGPLAAVSGRADEIVFLNERGELCEGARSNLFVRRGDHWLTPPLACGLLPGTLRARMLRTGAAREAVLHLADLAAPTKWCLGNSVRGLVPSTMVED